MVTTVLVPDAPWARAADWGDLPVRLAWYGHRAPAPQGDPEAEILIDATGPTEGLGALLRSLPRLRAIQTLYAGVERWAGQVPPGVMLVNASGAHGSATAEIATAGLLALYRGLPGFLADAAQRRWQPRMAETVGGKRVLVIGAGDVGQSAARQLAALGAEVDLAARTARAGVRDLAAALAGLGRYDVVLLAAPLTPATRGLADAGFLARMKDGAVLVNVGRGGLVVTDALLAELTTGRLRAVLDVTEPEPLPPDHPLWSAPGLILTPHIGGLVPGAFEKAMRVAIRQIAQLLAGRAPDNLVAPSHLSQDDGP